MATDEPHDVCAGSSAWVQGPESVNGVALQYHPTLAGMRGAARAVYLAVSGDGQAPDDEHASPGDALVLNASEDD